MHTFDKGSYESVQSVRYHPGPSSFFLILATGGKGGNP